MNVKIVGSHLCPQTLYSIIKCKEAGVNVSFVDLSGSLGALKEFLVLHEQDSIYAAHREMTADKDYVQNGKIGLPCFVMEDGTKTLELDRILGMAQPKKN